MTMEKVNCLARSGEKSPARNLAKKDCLARVKIDRKKFETLGKRVRHMFL